MAVERTGASGGYDLEFLDSPPDEYHCPICHLVMKDPQIVDCCGYKYCLGCIDRVSLASKPCPMCQEVTFKNMSEKQLQRKILDLKVYCVEKKHGCEWDGEIRQLEIHLNGKCLYVQVSCPLNCGKVMQRSKLSQHEEDDCPQRSPEVKLISLMRKLETRLVAVETKCSAQEEEMVLLRKELDEVKQTKEEQTQKIVTLEEKLKTTASTQEKDFTITLRAIEGELIRRCISFPVRVTIGGSETSWISPPFYSHPKGYVLQLKAKLQKFSSPVDSLAYSLFSSGRSPDKGRIKLSLNVLPQSNDGLEWPIYVSVDVLVLSAIDENSNAKMFTLVKYKSLSGTRRSFDEGEEEESDAVIIGHSRFCFSCRLLILNIHYSSEPPLVEQDTWPAINIHEK